MKKILLVEDNLAYIKLLRDQLTQNGFTIVEAKDGQEGLEKAKKEKPDVILLDIRMPTMDGMTMLSLLRKEEIQKKTKVIILSNFEPDSKTISQVIKTKPTYFCIKSTIKLNDLISKVKEVAG